MIKEIIKFFTQERTLSDGKVTKPLVKRTPLPAKDPDDFTLTKSSCSWQPAERYCPNCFKTIHHNEFMSTCCEGCGTFQNSCLDFGDRTKRKIYNGEKWVWQYRYKPLGFNSRSKSTTTKISDIEL